MKPILNFVALGLALGWWLADPGLANWLVVADEWPDLTPSQRGWFKEQRNANGFICCDVADGHPVDWDTRDGRYVAFWDNAWQAIPDEAVIKVPNRVGRAVLWLDPYRKPRCFIPGSGA